MPPTVILVDNRQRAAEVALQEQAAGRQVIIQEVLSDLSRGEASQINRVIRTLAR